MIWVILSWKEGRVGTAALADLRERLPVFLAKTFTDHSAGKPVSPPDVEVLLRRAGEHEVNARDLGLAILVGSTEAHLYCQQRDGERVADWLSNHVARNLTVRVRLMVLPMVTIEFGGETR